MSRFGPDPQAFFDAVYRQTPAWDIGDALRPALLGHRFGAVLDSGFVHLFEPDVADHFAEELAGCLHPGGRCYMLAFAVSSAPRPAAASSSSYAPTTSGATTTPSALAACASCANRSRPTTG